MDDYSSETAAPPQFTLGAVFVVIVVVALLLAIILPVVNAAREAGRRMQCQDNLKLIGSGLNWYHDTCKSLPPAYTPDNQMKPRCSWRVAISPCIACTPFYDQYHHDEPWNSRYNKQLGEGELSCYCYYQCPSDQAPGVNTSYVAVTGPRTAWPAPMVSRLGNFTRGLSSTILVPEMSESGIHWIEPRDLQFDQMEFKIYAPSRLRSSSGRGSRQALSSAHPGGAQMLFADGAVDFLSAETSEDVLREMLLIGKKESDGE